MNLRIKEKRVLIMVLFLYIVSLLVLFFFHNNWRDEAQAYLICRDMNIMEIFKNVPYEGHPMLYYLILYPFVKLGVGPKIVNLLAMFFMIASVYLIFFHTKMNVIQKICFVITWPVAYQFSVIGRSYALIFFLIVLLCVLYPKRKEYPILIGVIFGLLLNTHLLVVGFVMINAICFYCYEFFFNKENDVATKRRLIYSLCIFLFFCVLLFLQFYPILFIKDGMSLNRKISILDFIALLLCIIFYIPGSVYDLFYFVSIFVIGCLIYIFIRNDKVLLLKNLLNYFYISILCGYVYGNASNYMASVAFLIFLCSFIIIDIKVWKNKCITICFMIISFLSIINILFSYKIDILSYYSYSDSLNTANYINNHIDQKSIIMCNSDFACSSIAPYIMNKLYHTKSERFFTYVIWDKKRESKTDFNHLKKFINSNSDIYYIYAFAEDDSKELSYLKNEYSLKEIYETKKIISSDEKYAIYKIEE